MIREFPTAFGLWLFWTFAILATEPFYLSILYERGEALHLIWHGGFGLFCLIPLLLLLLRL